MESKDYLDLSAVVTLIIVTLLWGFNYPVIKYSMQRWARHLDSNI